VTEADQPHDKRPLSRRRRRQRARRIRIAIELTIGAAAIWFVRNPVAFPQLRAPDASLDSTVADTTDDLRDSSGLETSGARSTRSGLPSALIPKGRLFRSIEERARAGERIAVSMTAYCLQGRTRRGNLVRDGIIAVDRKLFPLGREVDLYFGREKYGRFLADDTGGVIKGAIIDVWIGDCSAARRFGRRRGYAQLVRRSQ
jgi:3D (Asp-Asp-Asp) domain-containing protein